METLGLQSDLITKMSYIYWIMPFYDYAYESVKILRSLCHKTNDLWKNEQDAIIRMFEKQIIHIDNRPIDEKTIEVLRRGDRYKLFKLEIGIDAKEQNGIEVLYEMLDEMQELEIYMIHVKHCNNEIVDTLAQKPIFKKKQDLFKVLDLGTSDAPERSEPYEYLQSVYHPEKHKMSCYVK